MRKAHRTRSRIAPPFMRSLLLSFVSLLSAVALVADEVPRHIDVGNGHLPATLINDVVVPLPGEVFSALDKLGSPNWHDVLRSTKPQMERRPQIALLLGVVIAEGFIAVEAKDAEEVKKIGRDVLTLANALNVRKSVIERTKSITDAADEKDWPKVRDELDKASHDVSQAMDEMQSAPLSQLVSLGGWLRGTEALTEVVGRNYSAEGAELLHQPGLLDYFEERLGAMDRHMKNDELVAMIQKRLPEIRPLIIETNGGIPAKSVDQIHSITEELVKAVNSREM